VEFTSKFKTRSGIKVLPGTPK